MAALSLPVELRSRVEFRAYARRTPLFTLNAGRVLVSLALPERLRADHVEFARSLAEQTASYAAEVERLYNAGAPVGRAA